MLKHKKVQKKMAATLLRRYSKLCTELQISYALLLGVSNHVGEIITQAVEKKKIDYLVIGRRGMSQIKRFFAGSTSKYVVEHCNCNVLVVKEDWIPLEANETSKQLLNLAAKEEKETKEPEDKQHTEVEHLLVDYQQSNN